LVSGSGEPSFHDKYWSGRTALVLSFFVTKNALSCQGTTYRSDILQAGIRLFHQPATGLTARRQNKMQEFSGTHPRQNMMRFGKIRN